MLTNSGHTCMVEHDAGLGAGFSDQEYELAGGKIIYSPHEVFGRADLLLKVTRPTMEELHWIRPETTLAGLLHLASARHEKVDYLLENGITAIAYELISMPDGTVPVRRPLSQIGGRLSAQIAARLLENAPGGKGILLGGVAGVPPAEVVIIGAGVVGSCASKAFVGLGAHVTVIDRDLKALEAVYECNQGIVTMISNPITIARACAYADVVVGAVLVPGERPPIVVTREMVRSMKPRSIIMDISIDEGGCVETSRPTTNDRPTFIEEGVIHYCVPNMPSLVARTSTHAFLNAAFPFVLDIINLGVDAAISENLSLARGVYTYKGEEVHPRSPQIEY
jgi:alanine dehydrogenase